MRLKVIVRFGVGAIVWALIVTQIGRVIASDPVQRYQAASQLNAYFFEDHYRIALRFEGKLWRPKIGDAVVAEILDDGETVPRLRQIGEIAEVTHVPEHNRTEIVAWIFPHARDAIRAGTHFTAFRGPEDIGGIVQTLFTPELRERLEGKLGTFLEKHGDELRARFEPLIQQAFSTYLNDIRGALDTAVEGQRERFVALIERHYNSSVKPELMPMLEAKAMPMVEQRVVPILRECGTEMFDKAPKGEIVWNFLRDALPWDSGNAEGKMRDWYNEEGHEIFDDYKPRIFAQIEAIAGELAEDEELRGLIDEMLDGVINDPELGEIIGAIVNEAIISNPQTPELLQAIWNTPDLQESIRWAAGKAEPYLVGATDMVLLAPGEPKRINPNLARVLRSQILWKDDFWIKVTPPAADTSLSADARFLPNGSIIPPERTTLTYRGGSFAR